jgi:hypothetical protein
MKTLKRSFESTLVAFTVALAGLASACDETHVLGDAPGGQAGQTGSPDGGTPTGGTAGSPSGPSPGTAGAKADPTTLGPAQSWTGYVENHTFPSGSDALALEFAVDANGVAAGTIVFGKGTPPPPATDPNVGYPPDLFAFGGLTLGPSARTLYVAEGYRYAFDRGSFDGHRLRFGVDMWQLWAGWCALQTPASDGSGGCLPNWSSTFDSAANKCSQTNPQTKKEVPVDCGKLSLCGIGPGVCSCTSAGCGPSTPSNVSTFDVFVTSDTASGSVQGSPLGAGNVHFLKK